MRLKRFQLNALKTSQLRISATVSRDSTTYKNYRNLRSSGSSAQEM